VKGVNEQVKALFDEQLKSWELAERNYQGLKSIQTKSFDFGEFNVKVQFNPARIVSSGAKVDSQSIAERKCFLCAENRPAAQREVDFGDYLILVNPFPVFPVHFTIPSKKHQPQEILPYFKDMLILAKAMDEYLVFYNGPGCGASAPDHLHFQAGTKDFLPLTKDYFRLKSLHAVSIYAEDQVEIFSVKNYLRTVICIESTDIEAATSAFSRVYESLQIVENEEPMMNIVCTFVDEKWYCFVIPRAAFRPWQYTAEGSDRLLISPATVEMSGIFITPIAEDFEKIQSDDVLSIIEQCSPAAFKLT
jgi:ATP adenylyltransferase/5',5'''-P-1,P-4-tetraphosphate phosphorylase II